MGKNMDKRFLSELVGVVQRAGAIIIENNGKERKVQHKGRIDLVTDTDLAVESFLKEELSALLPGSDFLAEETAAHEKLGELTWVIDPVDGTTNFAHGLPLVATSVGLWLEGEIRCGVVNLPLLGECFCALKGEGAWMNKESISVSSAEVVEQSLIATGFPYDIEDHVDEILAQLKNVLPRAQGVRRPGAAALDLAYVACGRYEGFYERALNPWDTAAGTLLVTEAGGRVTQYDPSAAYELGAPSILATNGRIHDELGVLIAV